MGIIGLFQRISEAREKQILAHARPCLAPDEHIDEWARVLHPEHRGSGFIYLTPRRFVVYWSRLGSEPSAIELKDIRTWGVDRDPEKGPVLGIETPDGSTFVRMIVGTDGMVTKVNAFLAQLALSVPNPSGPLAASSHPSDYKATRELKVTREKKTMATHTRRVIGTVVGVTVLVAGIALLFLPGPGILVVLLGLSLLAREYDWAQDILHWARQRAHAATERLRKRSRST